MHPAAIKASNCTPQSVRLTNLIRYALTALNSVNQSQHSMSCTLPLKVDAGNLIMPHASFRTQAVDGVGTKD
jgi:hypothetical protein